MFMEGILWVLLSSVKKFASLITSSRLYSLVLFHQEARLPPIACAGPTGHTIIVTGDTWGTYTRRQEGLDVITPCSSSGVDERFVGMEIRCFNMSCEEVEGWIWKGDIRKWNGAGGSEVNIGPSEWRVMLFIGHTSIPGVVSRSSFPSILKVTWTRECSINFLILWNTP